MNKNLLLLFMLFIFCTANAKVFIFGSSADDNDIKKLTSMKKNKKELDSFFTTGRHVNISSAELCDDLNKKKFSFIGIDEDRKKYNGVIEFTLRCTSSDLNQSIKIKLQGGKTITFAGYVDEVEEYHEKNFLNSNFKVKVYHWGGFNGKNGLYSVTIYDVKNDNFFVSLFTSVKEIVQGENK